METSKVRKTHSSKMNSGGEIRGLIYLLKKTNAQWKEIATGEGISLGVESQIRWELGIHHKKIFGTSREKTDT